MFTHLHCHSWFSLGEGASSPEALIAAAGARGFAALACTDTNAVYGAVEFQRVAEEAGIRPIQGAHLVQGGEECVALAMDERGWGALCRAITAIHWAEGRKGGRAEGGETGALEPGAPGGRGPGALRALRARRLRQSSHGRTRRAPREPGPSRPTVHLPSLRPSVFPTSSPTIGAASSSSPPASRFSSASSPPPAPATSTPSSAPAPSGTRCSPPRGGSGFRRW